MLPSSPRLATRAVAALARSSAPASSAAAAVAAVVPAAPVGPARTARGAGGAAPAADRPRSLSRGYVSLSRAQEARPTHGQHAPEPTSRVRQLFDGLVSGDRASLARSITLVESLREDHRLESQQLLSLILRREHGSAPPQPRTGADTAFPSGFRIGLSGAPGVGKSSFIETFGMFLISKGHKVAVLAVDPSSSRTGGSLLGDKTRMTELSRHDDAYVRPSPSSGSLGGVARNTNEAILLCSAAGYDIILVETVGVGQSETMVADMVDMFTLLVAPGAGDELQGMKKGIVELSDLILVNKADGELAGPARLAQIEYTSALKFIMPMTEGWYPKVLPVSSHQREGIDKAWETMKEYYGLLAERNELAAKRGAQQKKWMWRQITDELHWRLRTDPNVKGMVPEFERLVDNGEITSGQAAEEILDAFISGQSLRGSAAQKNPSVPAA